MKEILVGADPELFLTNANGEFVSSVGKIGGTKKKPRDIGNGCAVQEDNVAVEFNIAPAHTVEAFIESNQYALRYLSAYAVEKDMFLSITASKSFVDKELETPQARIFGCDPDYNAWLKKRNDPPKADDKNLRSCGGHIHLGFPTQGVSKIQVVRWFDVTAVLPSVLEDPDTQRRGLYGKAGCFRGRSYGVECRALSNYWLQSKELMEKVYHRGKMAAELAIGGAMLDDEEGKEIQAAINGSNKELAYALWSKYSKAYGEYQWV